MWRSLKLIPSGVGVQHPALVSGQAVIDGVVARSPKSFVTAKRTIQGRIKLTKNSLKPFQTRKPIHSTIGLRGIVFLLDAIKSALSSLELGSINPDSFKSLKIMGLIGLGILAFGIIPELLLVELAYSIGWQWSLNGIGLSVAESVLKISLFLGFLKVMRLFPEIKALLKYNTAKNKVFLVSEQDTDMSIISSMDKTSYNPWCELTFVILSFSITIFLSNVLFAIFPIGESFPFGLKQLYVVMWKLILMMSLAGLLYELIEHSTKNAQGRVAKITLVIQKKIQNLISIEPDQGEVEVALCSLKTSLALEKKNNLNNTVSDDVKVEVEICGLSDISMGHKSWKEFLEQ